MLTGDFNSRVGNEIVPVDKAFENLDMLMPPNILAGASLMQRSTCDPVQNAYGKSLLKLCKSLGLSLANGRTPGDRLGNFTCFTPRGPSLVDFVIDDSNSIKLIKTMRVFATRVLLSALPHFVYC